MKFAHALITVIAVPFLMGADGGCQTASQPPVEVVADTFCQTAKKRTWSVNDTPETIKEAITHNAGIDKACGVQGKAKVSGIMVQTPLEVT